MTKVDRILTKIYNLETNNSEHFSARQTTSNHTRSPSNPTKTVKVKLPKLELKPFDGNILNWQPFWDRFQSSIDSNSNISPVDKFAYLQSFLSPSASKCISGLTTTAENYNEAVELLKQRYGNTQVLINAHMQQFISLPVIKSVNDVQRLRKPYAKVESNLRNLKTLDVHPSTYGDLLVPLINEKLPNKLRLLISRKFEKEWWLLSDLLKHLKIEIEAKERSVSLGHFYTERVESNRDNRFTTSALLTSEESLEKTNRKCVFCNSISHSPWRCLKISNPQHKGTVLRRYGLCFIVFIKNTWLLRVL